MRNLHRRQKLVEQSQFNCDRVSAANFSKIGVPMDHKDVDPAALDYMTKRGHTMKSLKAANFSFIDGETCEYMYPQTKVGQHHGFPNKGITLDPETKACYWPLWAIILPFPNDEAFAVAKIEYHVEELGKRDDPREKRKFLTPTGRDLIPYIPKTVSRKGLLDASKPLFVIESYFKSVVAAAQGVNCIGVNGHCGAFTPKTHRAEICPGLLPYMLSGREVCLLTDADAKSNLQVRESLLAFMNLAPSLGCKPFYVDLGEGKCGIDDFFASGATLKDFQKLSRHETDSTTIRQLGCAFFEFTETGLGQRFEVQHGVDCRRDPNIKAWLTWTPKGYREGNVEPEARIIQTAASLIAETEAAKTPGEQAARAKFAKEMGKLSAQNAALTLAGRFPSMHIDATKFDSEPDQLGMQNGVLELSSGKLLEPRRDLLVTKVCPISYAPKLRSKLWEQFIDRAMDGNRELLRHTQEVAGSLLLGRADRSEVFFANGPSNSGKTVLIETFIDGLGPDYALASKAGILMKARQRGDAESCTPFLVALRGLRFVGCSELDQGETVSDSTLKDLSGGDTITARGLHKSPVTFRNTARIMVRCNYLPNVVGTDESVWSRIQVLPFNVVIPEPQRDKQLREKLAREFAGIFNWAYAGLRRYAERGYRFDVPKAITELMIDYRKKADTLGYWLDECVVLDPLKSHSTLRELQTEVTADYTAWTLRNNHQVLSAKTLWTRLHERLGYEPIYRGDHGVTYAKGFTLRRNPTEVSIIKVQNDEISKRDARIAELEADLAAAKATTSTTPSAKSVLRVLEGGRK